MSSVKLRVDDEIRPTVEALQQETDRLMEIAREVYVPAKVSDTVIGEVLPVPQQLQLYVTSAFVTLSSVFCQKKLANEPIPQKLRDQLARVEQYKKKLKEHGIDIDALGKAAAKMATEGGNSGAAVSSASAASKASGTRREREDESNQQQKPANDAVVDSRKTKVDPKAIDNVKKMTQAKSRKNMG